MMSLWDALRMNMMISYQELVRTFLSILTKSEINCIKLPLLILLSKSAFAIGLKECEWNLFRILVTTVARISTAAGQ